MRPGSSLEETGNTAPEAGCLQEASHPPVAPACGGPCTMRNGHDRAAARRLLTYYRSNLIVLTIASPAGIYNVRLAGRSGHLGFPRVPWLARRSMQVQVWPLTGPLECHRAEPPWEQAVPGTVPPVSCRTGGGHRPVGCSRETTCTGSGRDLSGDHRRSTGAYSTYRRDTCHLHMPRRSEAKPRSILSLQA